MWVKSLWNFFDYLPTVIILGKSQYNLKEKCVRLKVIPLGENSAREADDAMCSSCGLCIIKALRSRPDSQRTWAIRGEVATKARAIGVCPWWSGVVARRWSKGRPFSGSSKICLVMRDTHSTSPDFVAAWRKLHPALRNN